MHIQKKWDAIENHVLPQGACFGPANQIRTGKFWHESYFGVLCGGSFCLSFALSEKGWFKLRLYEVRFLRFSNSTGTFRGFNDDSCVLGLLLGLELSWPVFVWIGDGCTSAEVVSIISLYFLMTKLIWLLTSWTASRLSRSVSKSRITRASAKENVRSNSFHFKKELQI